jgi:hypothetical protein
MRVALQDILRTLKSILAKKHAAIVPVGIVAATLVTLSFLIEIAQQVFGPELFRTDLPMSLFAGILALSIAAAGFFILEIGLGVSLRRKDTYEIALAKAKVFTAPKIKMLRTRFDSIQKSLKGK